MINQPARERAWKGGSVWATSTRPNQMKVDFRTEPVLSMRPLCPRPVVEQNLQTCRAIDLLYQYLHFCITRATNLVQPESAHDEEELDAHRAERQDPPQSDCKHRVGVPQLSRHMSGRTHGEHNPRQDK